MDAEQLKNLQAPLKAQYHETPSAAVASLHAAGVVDLKNLTCEIEAPLAMDERVVAGLHLKAGGDGSTACSGDMLLQSLVACSGVIATGNMDFRGTLGVDRTAPVGLTEVALKFEVESSEATEKIDKLIQLTERYCVVLQTLSAGVSVTSSRA